MTSARIRTALLALMLCMALGQAAWADKPLSAPRKITVCSPGNTVCATSDPQTGITTVSPKAAHQQAWTIPGWHRWLFVSDDGESVVVGYGGENLVPVEVTLQEPVLMFYSKGKLVRSVTLGDLYKSKSQLSRTVSHYAWVYNIGINAANELVVNLVDGTQVTFVLATGTARPNRP